MSADVIARGLAVEGTLEQRLLSTVGLIIDGQSNERGNAEIANAGGVNQMTLFPEAFRSQRNPALTMMLPGINSMQQLAADGRWYPLGGPWMKVYDDLYDAGYNTLIFNASIGSQSFFTDGVGYPRARRAPNENNVNYFRQRRAAGTYGPSDPGCAGSLIVMNGYVFECTTGSEYLAVLRNEGGALYAGATSERLPDRLDYLYSPTATKKATGTPADAAALNAMFAGATALGSTVTDGAVVWTNIGSAATFGYSTNTAFQPKSVGGPGFDPMGIMRRGAAAGQSMRERGVGRVLVYLCNGQSDAGSTSQANYQLSLQYKTSFYRGLGFEVLIGLSTYARTASTAGYDALVAARTAALASFASDPGVHAGADLYSLMGNVEGQNGLTYNTAGTVADNNAHINAPAAIIAGGHHSAALLNALRT